jgi:hypothetical protein
VPRLSAAPRFGVNVFLRDGETVHRTWHSRGDGRTRSGPRQGRSIVHRWCGGSELVISIPVGCTIGWVENVTVTTPVLV